MGKMNNMSLKSEKDKEILIALEEYPFHELCNGKRYEYGTAGFRYNAKDLPFIFLRMGILIAIRSAVLNGEGVGIMCTASHNPKEDNGIKCIDSNGDMLDSSWEDHAEELVNASSSNDIIYLIKKLLKENKNVSKVHFGRDTRSHSKSLIELAMKGSELMGATICDHGIVTTPQLHFIVNQSNPKYILGFPSMEPNEDSYFNILCQSYVKLLRTKESLAERKWFIDCACGVGYKKLMRIKNIFSSQSISTEFIPFNSDSEPFLNEKCGADYVQKNQTFPSIYSTLENFDDQGSYVSFDGDADRIVFYYQQQHKDFCLLDGDRISIFIAKFLQQELLYFESNLTLGVVQTAYANGSSTHFLKNELNIHVETTKTGVKYLHPAAIKFDIGVYFEANGHGTVLFGSNFYTFLQEANPKTQRQVVALKRLQILPRLINQSVGDALSDLLLVDAILFLSDDNFSQNPHITTEWMKQWHKLYVDMPSRQLKVAVSDRSIIKTNHNETRVIYPIELQSKLDLLINEFMSSNNQNKQPRCFVRPSGTEDVVRVYAEALSKHDCNSLAEKAAQIVRDVCNTLACSKP